MRVLIEIARVMVGGVFMVSGLIKVNDPVGTAIKLEEYFQIFAYDIAPVFELLVPASLFLSVVLNVLEVVLGIALLIGFRPVVVTYTLLGLIVFFTALTFYSAYFNKVTDCGCFGDAIKLTPWQSFQKDVVLLVLIVFLFLFKKNIKSYLSPVMASGVVAGSAFVLVFTADTAIRHLPFIDFRTYAVGNSIPQLMQPTGELEYVYIMEKDGETFEFESHPTDQSYAFKSLEVLNPEVQPEITDFSVWNDEGEFTDRLLTGNRLVFVIYNTEKASSSHMDEINALARGLPEVEKCILTASGYEQFEAFRHQYQLSIPYYYADATVLKTIIRSNPGIILLQNGVMRGKWHYNDVPSAGDVRALL